MKFRHAAVLGLMFSLAAVGSGRAQDMYAPPDGWYLRIQGGYNILEDMNGKGSTGGLDFSASHGDGYILGGGAGYRWGPLALEWEVDYRDNGVDSVHFNNGGALGVAAGTNQGGAGRISSFTQIISGVADLPWKPTPRITPYVGFGIGFSNIRLGGYGGAQTHISGDTDTVFALQPKIGARYMLSPSVAMGLEYRFLDALSPQFVDSAGNKFSGSYHNHSIMLNLTWYLGGPSAPPPPTPAVAPAPAAAPAPPSRQVFIVFFDFDKSTITPAGKQIIAEAAKAYMRGQRVLLTGYTDRAGTPKYNLGLSKRRADAARAEMIRDGVPANAINASWKGEEDPRVPTPDGVREPQNRRVEIVLP
jgi:outer membrane protein OmpA-like peptidoglycan-associated protein